MKTMTFYVLKNKNNGKYVYENIHFTFKETEYFKKETDNIYEIMAYKSRFYLDLNVAKTFKFNMEKNYNIELEIIEIDEYTTYKEIKNIS